MRLSVLLLLTSSAAFAQQGFSTAPSSGIPLPVESSALDDSPLSLSANPGGLAFLHGLELDYLRAQSYADYGSSGDGLFAGGKLGPLALAGSVEWLVPADCGLGQQCRFRSRRTTLGLGLQLGWLGVGVTRHAFSSDESYLLDKLSSWDLGAMLRPFRWLSISGAILDVDGGSFGPSAHLQRRGVVGLALRPLGEALALSAEAEAPLETGCAAVYPSVCRTSTTSWRFTLDGALSRGLHALAQVGYEAAFDRWSGQLGLAIDFGNAGILYSQSGRAAAGPSGDLRVRLSTDALPSFSVDHASLIKLDEALAHPKGSLTSLVLGSSPRDPHAQTLAALRKLAADPTVRAVVLRSSGLPGSAGRNEELRKEIENLRSAGKKVLFYLESGGDLDYYVATAADRILAAPQSVLQINGFSATLLFAAAGLAKLGVKAEFIRVGAYKNAPDLFTRSEMSREQREVEDALLDDVYGRYVHAVVERRHLDEGKFKALLDRGLLRPEEAVEAGLLDGLGYPDELEREVGKLLGRRVPLREVAVPGGPERDERWGTRPRIALIRVEGDIAGGETRGDPLGAVTAVGSSTVVKQIRKAADDARVKAIVVRIDSPGGDGNASDLIWRELIRARKEKGKPVVASMGDVAASGGYYVAVGCDAIFAEPGTITGSIGVFVPKFDATELFDKLGVKLETVKRGKSADIFGINRPLSDEERSMMQAWVDDFYGKFVSRVAEARKLSREEVDAVARGRVWSGAQAQQRKLVDTLGSLDDALADAAARAGLKPGEDVDVEDQGRTAVFELAQLAGGGVSEQPFTFGALGVLPVREAQKALRAVQLLGEPGTLRAVLPYTVELH